MSLARDIVRGSCLPASQAWSTLQQVRGAVFVETKDVIHELCEINTDEVSSAPVFRKMWCEHKASDAERGVLAHTVELASVGEQIRKRLVAKCSGIPRFVVCSEVVYRPTGNARHFGHLGRVWFGLNQEGKLVNGRGSIPYVAEVNLSGYEREIAETVPEDLAGMAALPLFVFAFLNCKNIAIEPTSGHRNCRPDRARKAAGLSWHRLVIVPSSLRNDGPIVRHGNGEPLVRAHLTRGHFKTYTADRPLLGQLVGTFWWSPHVRGSKKLGVVLKDYELRTTEAGA